MKPFIAPLKMKQQQQQQSKQYCNSLLSTKPALEDNLVGRNRPDDPGWEGVIEVVGRKSGVRRCFHFKLLHDAGTKKVKLFFCQRLAQTDPLSNSKRCYPVILNKLPILIQEPVWIERVRISKGVGIIHDIVQTSTDNSVLWYDVFPNLDILGGVMWNSGTNQTSSAQALLESCIQIVQLGLVIQGWEPVSANNLK